MKIFKLVFSKICWLAHFIAFLKLVDSFISKIGTQFVVFKTLIHFIFKTCHSNYVQPRNHGSMNEISLLILISINRKGGATSNHNHICNEEGTKEDWGLRAHNFLSIKYSLDFGKYIVQKMSKRSVFARDRTGDLLCVRQMW